MNSTRLKAVVIGLGRQAVTDHVPAMMRRDDVQIIGCLDVNRAVVKQFADNFPTREPEVLVTDNLGQLLGLKPDFAVVAVPHDKYPEIIRALLDRGIPFVKEKPLARNLFEAEEYIRDSRFVQLAFICTQRRYSPVYEEAYKRLPELGQIYHFSARYRLNIHRPHEGWRGNKSLAGGGCILDMGYHIIDQLTWWFGSPDRVFASVSAKAVAGVGEYAEDSATIAFSYKNGLHGSIELSRSSGGKLEEYLVSGSNGHIWGSKRAMALKDLDGNTHQEVSVPDDSQALDRQYDFFIDRVKTGLGFSDVIESQWENMKVIDRCYQEAERSAIQQNANVQTYLATNK